MWRRNTCHDQLCASSERALGARRRRAFASAAAEQNGTLIRSDLVASLGQLSVQTRSEQVRETALALIATETDDTYRKKYARVWRTSGIAAP